MKRTFKGSITIEITCLLPIIALVFVLSVWGSFYYHDKNILSSCAYETVVMGSVKAREKENVSAEMLNRAFRERIKGKCILFSDINSSVQMSEDKLTLTVSAKRRTMQVSVIQSAAITQPEEYIRKVRKLR